MRKVPIIGVLLALALACGRAGADEVTDLKKELERQYDVLLKMQAKLLELEDTQKKNSKAIADVAEQAPAAGSLGEKLAWVEKLQLYGDFRYRHEYIDEQARKTRNRNRIRARIGLKAEIADDWTLNVRLATGSSNDTGESADPVSTNQTLTDSFSSKHVWLDLAYLTWTPMDDLKILMGKMGFPFIKVGKNQLIWDGDLNPEGVAMSYDFGLTEGLSGRIVAGGFYVDEDSAGGDTTLWGLQGSLKAALADDSYLLGGVSYYDYQGLEGEEFEYLTYSVDETGAKTAGGFGNTLDGRDFRYDYNLLEFFGEYGFQAFERPASVYGSYVVNTAGSVKEDTGWLIGTKLGKTKAPGSWAVGYEYRDVEADAVVGGFTDSDFIGGGTAGRGHKFSAAYQMSKNVTAALTVFLSEKHDAPYNNGHDYDRLQLDMIVKF